MDGWMDVKCWPANLEVLSSRHTVGKNLFNHKSGSFAYSLSISSSPATHRSDILIYHLTGSKIAGYPSRVSIDKQ